MNWEPSHADHSIDRAIVTLTLREAVDENTFDELVVSGRKAAAAHNLSSRVDAQEPIELPPGGGIISFNNFSALRRVGFRRLDPDQVSPNEGVVDEFSISRQRIIFLTQRYRRWADLRRLFIDILAALELIAPITQGIKTAKIEYVDSFKSRDLNGDHFEVIRKDSKYISAIIAEKGAAFHVHCGWFDFETATVRKLTNINIDVFDSTLGELDSRRRISVLTLAQFDALDGVLERPLDRLEELHDYLKGTFREIISDDAGERVALNQ